VNMNMAVATLVIRSRKTSSWSESQVALADTGRDGNN